MLNNLSTNAFLMAGAALQSTDTQKRISEGSDQAKERRRQQDIKYGTRKTFRDATQTTSGTSSKQFFA